MSDSHYYMSGKEFSMLREFFFRKTGRKIKDNELHTVEKRLTRFMVQYGLDSFKELFHKMINDITGTLRNIIVSELITPESVWFRDTEYWALIEKKIIPELIDQLKSGKKNSITIWSAAAATGEEPYSFCMLLNRILENEKRVSASQFRIIASDISPSSLFFAISGRYDHSNILSGVSDLYVRKYFSGLKSVQEINDDVKGMVDFVKLDLREEYTNLPIFDLVLCRNVSSYFTLEEMNDIFYRMYDNMNKDGYLIIGKEEDLSLYTDFFNVVEYEGIKYYRPKNFNSQSHLMNKV